MTTSSSNTSFFKSLLIIGLLCFSTNLMAQTASVPNVLKMRSAKSSGEILEDNKLVGYYIFYFKEKADKKNSSYEVQIFDDNFNSVKSFGLTRPRNSALLEVVYNGKVFIFFFYNAKTGYEFVTFDKKGEQVGSLKTEKKDIPSFDIQRSAASLSSDAENVTFFPYGKEGFVRQSYAKNKKLGYALIAYDNEMEELWTISSPEDSKLVETVEISTISETLITATIYRKKSLMTRKMDAYFMFIDAKNGKVIKEISMGSADEGKLTVLKTHNEGDKVLLIGEYFKPGDDFMKDKSQGLFIKETDTKGTELSHKQFAWDTEIAKFKNENLDEEDQKAAKDGFSIFFHDAIRAKNGHMFLIGEQFRKQVSALGVTAGILGGGDSDVAAMEIRVSNMIVIELDEKNEIVDFKVVNKKRTSVLLQKGMGIYSSAFLGYYVKATGGFDYSFTSNDPDHDEYTIVYTDYNRKEKKGDKAKQKADKMLGVIHIKDGKMETHRVPINTEAKRWWIEPAKTGNISIMEYYKKEKRLDMRLEKLVY